MDISSNSKPVWYCGRTKPRQEHIAAANVRKSLGLDVFLPRLRYEKPTRRGVVCVVEPVFPCYIFIQSRPGPSLDAIRYTSGISTLVHFGHVVPTIPESTISDLKKCFADDGVRDAGEEAMPPGSAVRVGEGAFAHLAGVVLKPLPARKRVQILLEILGRPTAVEVDSRSVLREKRSLFALIPALAA